MRSLRSSWILRALAAAGVLPFLFAPTAAEARCFAGDPVLECRSRTEFTTYTGFPTVLCLIGFPVVRIESIANCQGNYAGPAVVYRCSATSTPFSYSGGGFTHTFGTASNWLALLNGDCDDLLYTPTED